MERRLSCLADPAALVATQVKSPASAGWVKKTELIQRILVRLRAEENEKTDLSPLDDQLS